MNWFMGKINTHIFVAIREKRLMFTIVNSFEARRLKIRKKHNLFKGNEYLKKYIQVTYYFNSFMAVFLIFYDFKKM